MSTPNEIERRITAAGMNLRGAAPQGWDTMVAALREYSNALAQSLISAPQAEFVLLQGRAQMADRLATKFENVVIDHENNERKRK